MIGGPVALDDNGVCGGSPCDTPVLARRAVNRDTRGTGKRLERVKEAKRSLRSENGGGNAEKDRDCKAQEMFHVSGKRL